MTDDDWKKVDEYIWKWIIDRDEDVPEFIREEVNNAAGKLMVEAEFSQKVFIKAREYLAKKCGQGRLESLVHNLPYPQNKKPY